MKKSDGYICGQWYHTALFILKWGEESYYYVSDYTEFQDVAYIVDAVVLYVSVAVELWDFHQGTSVQNDQTHHSHSPEKKHVMLVFILFFFIYLFLVLYDNHEWVTSSIPNEH